MNPEPRENEGQRVYRYLKTVVSWSLAAHRLTKRNIITTDSSLDVYLVRVPTPDNTCCSEGELVDFLLDRFEALPGLFDLPRAELEKFISKHYSATFTGTVHVEAALMGLLAYADNQISHTAIADADELKAIITVGAIVLIKGAFRGLTLFYSIRTR